MISRQSTRTPLGVVSPSMRVLSFTIALLFVSATTALAGKPEVFTPRFSSLAVSGYDAVAYFEQGEAVKGSNAFSYDYNGATWRFSSAENLDAFQSDPEAYAPQYGGYCAWAVSQNYTASADPKSWAIHNGKLYLNYNDDVQADWMEDPDGFIALADANWPSVLD
ncbi:MAG: YHS domain-containing (seleno)protein [Pseudomonadota bacterium]